MRSSTASMVHKDLRDLTCACLSIPITLHWGTGAPCSNTVYFSHIPECVLLRPLALFFVWSISPSPSYCLLLLLTCMHQISCNVCMSEGSKTLFGFFMCESPPFPWAQDVAHWRISVNICQCQGGPGSQGKAGSGRTCRRDHEPKGSHPLPAAVVLAL